VLASPPPRTSKPDVSHVCTDRSAAVEQYGSEAAEQLRWYQPAPHWLPTRFLLAPLLYLACTWTWTCTCCQVPHRLALVLLRATHA